MDTLAEVSTIVFESRGREPEKSGGFVATISKNVVASLARVVAVSLIALVLPAYLTHHLPVTTYAAWVLILQLGAYVSYLDLGIQTGVSKFVAEYNARGDRAGAGRHASAGLALMIFAGMLGMACTLILAWQVPRLFSKMPSNLYHDVRISVVLVGFSLSFGLICAVYSAVFLGLQRYAVPMTLSVVNRASFAAIVLAVVALHSSLAVMGMAVALVNAATGLLQVVAWRAKASHICYIHTAGGLPCSYRYGPLLLDAIHMDGCDVVRHWTRRRHCWAFRLCANRLLFHRHAADQLRLIDHRRDDGSLDARIFRHEHASLRG